MMELLAKKEEEILGKEEAGTIRTTRAPDICSTACHFGIRLGPRLAHKCARKNRQENLAYICRKVKVTFI